MMVDNTIKILIIDDLEIQRTILMDVLSEKLRAKCFAVKFAKEALKVCKEEQPVIILLDCNWDDVKKEEFGDLVSFEGETPCHVFDSEVFLYQGLGILRYLKRKLNPDYFQALTLVVMGTAGRVAEGLYREAGPAAVIFIPKLELANKKLEILKMLFSIK